MKKEKESIEIKVCNGPNSHQKFGTICEICKKEFCYSHMILAIDKNGRADGHYCREHYDEFRRPEHKT